MVKKMKKYVKFVVCMALIMGLIAPSYAALSASDGSAFVTKAEFDSALADFNARLTTFEAGINSKIDSQVTSYLDRNGIWNGKKQTLIPAQKYTYYKFTDPDATVTNTTMPVAMIGNCLNMAIWDKWGTDTFPANSSGSVLRTPYMSGVKGRAKSKTMQPYVMLGIWPIKVVCNKSGLLEWHYVAGGGMNYVQLWEMRSSAGERLNPAKDPIQPKFYLYNFSINIGLINCDLDWFKAGDENTTRSSAWCLPTDFTIKDSLSWYDEYGFQVDGWEVSSYGPIFTTDAGEVYNNYDPGIARRALGDAMEYNKTKFKWPFGEYFYPPSARMDLPRYVFVTKGETVYLTSWFNVTVYFSHDDTSVIDNWLDTIYLGFSQSGNNGSNWSPQQFANNTTWKIY